MTRTLLVTAVLVGVIVVAFAAWRPSASTDIPTAVVERGVFIDDLPLRGEIRPERSIALTAPSAGGGDMQIVQLIANGTPVDVGEVIVVFDSTNQQRTLEQKESERKQAESELEKARAEEQRRVRAAEAELADARSVAERARLDLGAAELLSKVDAEKRAIAVRNAEQVVAELQEKVSAERDAGAADVAIAVQKVEKVRYDVADTRRIIEALSVRAPARGMVSLMPNFRAGGPMSRTAPEFRRGDRAWAGAAIAELPDLTSVRITVRADEADRARLRVDGQARIRVDALPDRELEGRISEISLVATPDFTSFPPVRNFDVLVALSASDPRLRSGMSATARLEIDRLDDALLVPTGAVFERNGESVVFVVGDRGQTRRVVTIARRGRERIAVADGIHVGERVVLQAPDEGDRP
jgi:multidrug resistance efflux pump